MEAHSSILAWEIPWTEEPGGLQSIGSQTVRHDQSNSTHMHFPSSILYTFQPGQGSSSGIESLCLFILYMGFSRQEYWSGLPFLCPVDHILS